ncbi:hypothetical protein RchiOBHm_Chr7g0239401 [Rosa chinensis]|uniref:Uncharacterized protein n=1 Tax=Rosa chinensis TaxID=74649 RepID=A0A2P6PHP1_ROSCH|nr:hypothetical protein RchiOBHm_Chr7g0239401 [Rosa chinensis]
MEANLFLVFHLEIPKDFSIKRRENIRDLHYDCYICESQKGIDRRGGGSLFFFFLFCSE